MEKIKLSQNKEALIDVEDYHRLKKYKWYVSRSPWGYCARANIKENGKRKTLYMHRHVMNAPENKEIDHINHNGLDNRKTNLRVCSHAENMRNRKKNRNSISKFKGVKPAGKKDWQAIITINDKEKYLGCFTSEIEAAIAYNQAAIEYFGEFAFLNPV